MNDLRDDLQELADGCPHGRPPPAAARRRGRDCRRRAAAAAVLAGVLAVAVVAGLARVLTAPRPAGLAGPPPTGRPVEPPRSTAWFRPTHVPDGYRRTVEGVRAARAAPAPRPGLPEGARAGWCQRR